MCGIAGVIDFNKPIPEKTINRMLDMIVHRGPDDYGILEDNHFQLGMRRLSIIDLSTGHQPIYNEDKSIFTFFNGEIYNYIELRQELESKGHHFSTHTDTEVLVHLYESFGINFLNRLNGMFSFIIADLKKRKFYIVRDRMGIKPLYYYWRNSRLLFASELKAILGSGIVNVSLDETAMVKYLGYGYIPSPYTPFNEVNKLEAGHYLELGEEGIKDIQWYDLQEFFPRGNISRAEASETVRELFLDSVKLQMRSDVPVGAYLSGGVDSSLIVATASANTNIPISTFSVGFEQSEFDELPYAKQVAERYGTKHHELYVSSEDAIKLLPELMWYMDEPIGDSAILPSYLVSRLASQHVKVCLSGLGGDELFGGYQRYFLNKGKLAGLMGLPRPLIVFGAKPLLGMINKNWKQQLNALLDPKPASLQYFDRIKQMQTEFIGQLMPQGGTHYIGEEAVKIYEKYPARDVVNNRMFVDQHLYINDQLLALTDRMSMAVSLEARVPFLDHRLVEYVNTLPGSWKVGTKDFKIILKEALGDLLPESILNRPKWGFAAPHKSWVLNKGVKQIMEQTMEGDLLKDGILNRDSVRGFLGNEEMVQKRPTWVWPLVAMELWYTQYKKFI